MGRGDRQASLCRTETGFILGARLCPPRQRLVLAGHVGPVCGQVFEAEQLLHLRWQRHLLSVLVSSERPY